ncbi:hypothetical protein Leryth_014623 [Lithospermum erythrorhizon]|nr:hypothetical protein Leryth_014623 [Lithospermum erythrorhizon]
MVPKKHQNPQIQTQKNDYFFAQNSNFNKINDGNGINIWKKRKKQKKPLQEVFMFEKDFKNRLQEVVYSKEYIFSKIFRKDGPPLGEIFDSLPPHAFIHCKKRDSKNVHRACQEHQQVFKRRKHWMPALDDQNCLHTDAPLQKHGIGKGLMSVKSATTRSHGMGKGLMTRKHVPMRGHGIGKGLMTVWHVTNPNAVDIPADFLLSESQPKRRKKKQQRRQLIAKQIVKKAHEKSKPCLRSRKVLRQKVEKCKQPWEGKCELALEEVRSQRDQDQFAALVDDEELELQELQAGSNPFTCSAHLKTNGLHGCSLCKDLLSKFPPNSVKMKLPLDKQPWDSSLELVKKLIKAYHFFCTYAVKIDMFSFTLDEFAQAFLDKDSLLLGQAHLSLLKVLLSDLEMDLTHDNFPHATKNYKFLRLLQFVENQEFVMESWKKSLKPLTWIEILRQVLIAAGYGSKISTSPGKTSLKEVSLMGKYGLTPGTLKGELFTLLLTQGSLGMKVFDMALSAPIVDLDLAPATHELEALISSTLATDVSLFEKISSSGYRLRVISSTQDTEICGSVSNDFGSVHDISEASGGQNSDSECEHWDSDLPNSKHRHQSRSQSSKLTLYTEIDESNPGEPWLLGLMEGEYSDLNVEEKLNALAALIDLVDAGSSIRVEDTVALTKDSAPNIYHRSSGAR